MTRHNEVKAPLPIQGQAEGTLNNPLWCGTRECKALRLQTGIQQGTICQLVYVTQHFWTAKWQLNSGTFLWVNCIRFWKNCDELDSLQAYASNWFITMHFMLPTVSLSYIQYIQYFRRWLRLWMSSYTQIISDIFFINAVGRRESGIFWELNVYTKPLQWPRHAYTVMTMSTKGSFPGGKAAGAWTWPHPSNIEVKNA